MEKWHEMYLEFITQHKADLQEILDFVRANEPHYPHIDFNDTSAQTMQKMLESAKFWDFHNEILLDNLASKIEKILKQCQKDML